MQRIVCLTGETVDILHRLGAASSIVGVTAFTEHPAAAGLPVVSGYTSFKYDKIEALRPTLVLAYSSLQADAVAELSRRGLNVLITHQSTLASVFETIQLIGGVTGRTAEAAELIGQLQAKLNEASQAIPAHAHRPKVYFEEWDDPLVTGVTWISELIQACLLYTSSSRCRDGWRASSFRLAWPCLPTKAKTASGAGFPPGKAKTIN